MRLISWQHRTGLSILCLVLLGLSHNLMAQNGQQLATVCAACHGADGNSSTTIWPKLAGQHASYIADQTKMIRDGQRSVPEMLAIVAGLSDADIDSIAEHFAAQSVKPGVADEELVTLGKNIYQSGLADQGVIACQACHGPVGKGNPSARYPALAGQHADYLVLRLKRYRDGQTNGSDDPYSAQMVLIAESLGDHEIAAVASYLEGLYDQRQ